ncbi:MAG: tautomerase family protein [Synergistaceae bacterium]|nr:tautomerase family protein [Synergistaceae bacterium]
MPIIQVHLIKGRSTEAKREFAAKVTDLACDCLKTVPGNVRVIFYDMPHEDFAIGGTLVCDRDKEKK